ncbi:chaperonin 10-like protein [Aspergillus pseudotamarii]|uniref:Chaperonin 10-like protein n=1 Tax=Aspergillus pseudotamarii TaxID=132259 RepID=A0A5N6T6F6_ASPPS|nr:chaperonin 10-like protein [Aspergillus pseudotamarii]KAE8141913.1 chaperonin 10-like protein [Aspergillus pseudotamarii]
MAHSLPNLMKAWTFSHAGSAERVLQLSQQQPIPTLSTNTDVLIRITHVSLHPGTTIMMNLVPFIFRNKPCIAETDFSGLILSTGKEVPVAPSPDNEHRYFPPGTPVFGSIPVGQHLKGAGALAEYLVVDVSCIARKPANISFAQAAALPVSGTTALTLLDAADIRPGDRVLINAPCGGIGHLVTQLVSHVVAEEGRIVGRCSAASFDVAKTLGCNDVVSYNNSSDLSITTPTEVYGEEPFDKIIDARGSQDLCYSSPAILKCGVGHTYTSVGPVLESYTYLGMLACLLKMGMNRFLPVWAGGVDREYRQVTAIVSTDKLERLRKLCEAGQLSALIGDTWPFEDAVQAFHIMAGRHARGKLVICVSEPSA